MKKKNYRYYGLGFPVLLENIEFLKIDGAMAPNIDYIKLEELVLPLIAQKPTRLTGAEIKFIRHHFRMSLIDFAKRFGVTHPAVMKWESAGNKSSKVSWNTEKDIRLFAAEKTISNARFYDLYKTLEKPRKEGANLYRFNMSTPVPDALVVLQWIEVGAFNIGTMEIPVSEKKWYRFKSAHQPKPLLKCSVQTGHTIESLPSTEAKAGVLTDFSWTMQ